MVYPCYLLFQCSYFAIILGYPLLCLSKLHKEGNVDEKWIYYFFLLTILFIGELTVLFPLKWLLGKIDFCMFPTVKALFALWLYYPKEKNGIELIMDLIGKYLDSAFIKINGICGSFAEKIGIKNKDIAGKEKKNE